MLIFLHSIPFATCVGVLGCVGFLLCLRFLPSFTLLFDVCLSSWLSSQTRLVTCNLTLPYYSLCTQVYAGQAVAEVVEIKRSSSEYGTGRAQLEQHLELLEWALRKVFPALGTVVKVGHLCLPRDAIAQQSHKDQITKGGVSIIVYEF